MAVKKGRLVDASERVDRWRKWSRRAMGVEEATWAWDFEDGWCAIKDSRPEEKAKVPSGRAESVSSKRGWRSCL